MPEFWGVKRTLGTDPILDSLTQLSATIIIQLQIVVFHKNHIQELINEKGIFAVKLESKPYKPFLNSLFKVRFHGILPYF